MNFNTIPLYEYDKPSIWNNTATYPISNVSNTSNDSTSSNDSYYSNIHTSTSANNLSLTEENLKKLPVMESINYLPTIIKNELFDPFIQSSSQLYTSPKKEISQNMQYNEIISSTHKNNQFSFASPDNNDALYYSNANSPVKQQDYAHQMYQNTYPSHQVHEMNYHQSNLYHIKSPDSGAFNKTHTRTQNLSPDLYNSPQYSHHQFDHIPEQQQHIKSQDAERYSNSTTQQAKQEVHTKNTNYKTELCQQFPNCPYSSKCQFAHGLNELVTKQHISNYKTKDCVNFKRVGECKYGIRCCFRH